MAWQERTVEIMREEFVKRALSMEKVKLLCAVNTVSAVRQAISGSVDFWRGAHVKSKPGAPNSSKTSLGGSGSGHCTHEAEISCFGAVKIRKIMDNDGYPNLPSARTINNIFHRNNLISKAASQAAAHYKRFEKVRPNDMWQADFKGHFQMQNGERCYPLNILDDCSRFCLCSDALRNETLGEVKPVFQRLFRNTGFRSVCFATTETRGEPLRAWAIRRLKCGLWSWAFSRSTDDRSTRRPKGKTNDTIAPLRESV